VRPDLELIAGLVPSGARVLDVGCGDGALLHHLSRNRGCRVQGVERDPDALIACMRRGIPVLEVDADKGLADFGDGAFDVVVLSQTLQALHRPREVLREIVRVGAVGIVSFPNFGHWRVRLQLLARGRMPVSRTLPHPWHSTPNLHLCTIVDFEETARREGIEILQRRALDPRGLPANGPVVRHPNLLAAGAAYLIRRRAR